MAKYYPHRFFGSDEANPDLDFRVKFREAIAGKFGDYTMYAGTHTSDDVPVACHAMFAALRRELEDLDPQEGERVIIAYRGKGVTNSGHSFHKFAASMPERQPGGQAEPSGSPSQDEFGW